MLSFDEAQAVFAMCAEPVRETETVWLGLLTGRVLARDLSAVIDTPAADRSAMDGYAVRCEDCRGYACLPLQQVVYAGTRPQPLLPGHAIRIYTGGVIPPGADAVVALEDVEESYRGVVCARGGPAHPAQRRGCPPGRPAAAGRNAAAGRAYCRAGVPGTDGGAGLPPGGGGHPDLGR